MVQLPFKEDIEDRCESLSHRIKILQSLEKPELIGPTSFTKDDIRSTVEPYVVGKKVGVNNLEFLWNIRKFPSVYIFEIDNESMKSEIIDAFTEFRNSRAKAASKLIPQLNCSSTVMYVGSIGKDLHNRIKQHLGHGTHTTYAMQLKDWLPQSAELNLYHMPVIETIRYDLEAGIAKHLAPFLGRVQN